MGPGARQVFLNVVNYRSTERHIGNSAGGLAQPDDLEARLSVVAVCAPELLGDLGDDETELPNCRMIDHRASVGLEIHPLAHPHILQRITWRASDCEAPMKHVAIRLAAGHADDVVGGGLVTMHVESSNLPGTMLWFVVSESELLLQMENIALLSTRRFGRDPPHRRAAPVLLHARRTRAPVEERNRVEDREGFSEIGWLQDLAGTTGQAKRGTEEEETAKSSLRAHRRRAGIRFGWGRCP